MTFAVKNKERPKLLLFENGRTIKDKILSMSRQREGRARHKNIDHRHRQPEISEREGNIQHNTTLGLTFLLQCLMETT